MHHGLRPHRRLCRGTKAPKRSFQSPSRLSTLRGNAPGPRMVTLVRPPHSRICAARAPSTAPGAPRPSPLPSPSETCRGAANGASAPVARPVPTPFHLKPLAPTAPPGSAMASEGPSVRCSDGPASAAGFEIKPTLERRTGLLDPPRDTAAPSPRPFAKRHRRAALPDQNVTHTLTSGLETEKVAQAQSQ